MSQWMAHSVNASESASPIAAQTTDFNPIDPGNNAPAIGADATVNAKLVHFAEVRCDCNSTSSATESHDFPTDFDEANRLFPTPAAFAANDLLSCDAKPAIAAANTAMIGQNR